MTLGDYMLIQGARGTRLAIVVGFLPGLALVRKWKEQSRSWSRIASIDEGRLEAAPEDDSRLEAARASVRAGEAYPVEGEDR